MSQSLFVIAGEMSGDIHAAELLKVLRQRRPALRVAGAGGPRMREVGGPEIRDWLDRAAVMGIVEVLKHYPFFKQSFDSLLAEAIAAQPDVVLLVDYPGFNFRFAAAIRRVLPKTRILQYVCPQVWAWKKGRIPKMAKLFDEILCLLPFEPGIFATSGPRARFVGHPLIDELEAERLECEREPGLIGLMPGSRGPEIEKLLPTLLETAVRLRRTDKTLRFEIPAANPALRAKIEAKIGKSGLGNAARVLDGGAHALMQRAHCGIVASGTATVEAAYYGLPYCLVYRLAWPTYLVARSVLTIKLVGLINIIAKEEVVEEFIQSDADPCRLATAMRRFLDDPDEVAALQAKMTRAVAQLGGPGAHERAADAVEDWLD